MKFSFPQLSMLVLLAALVFSCKPKEEVAKPMPPREPMNAGTAEKTATAEGDVKVTTKEERMEALKNFPDSLYASIQRTPCFGQCPTYIIKVYKGGYATYEGIRFTKMEGKHVGKVSAKIMEQIAEKANTINYFGLESEYDGPVTDLPSTITQLQLNGKKKEIKARFKAPDELRAYEKFIDGLFELIEWQPAPEE